LIQFLPELIDFSFLSTVALIWSVIYAGAFTASIKGVNPCFGQIRKSKN